MGGPGNRTHRPLGCRQDKRPGGIPMILSVALHAEGSVQANRRPYPWLSDYILRNNFDALIVESSEALAKEAFQRMDVQLELSMCMAVILEGQREEGMSGVYHSLLKLATSSVWFGRRNRWAQGD